MSTMSSEFAREVLKVSVAQICTSMNFDSAESHALETLVDVVGQYIETIGRKAALLAEHDGRTRVNYDDILSSFDQMEPRVDWRELKHVCEQVTWDVPFNTGIPDFPTGRPKVVHQYGHSIAADDENPHDGDSSIPDFFPKFPSPHTYKRTEVDATDPALQDPKAARKRVLDERFQVRGALAKIFKADALESKEMYGTTPGVSQQNSANTSSVADGSKTSTIGAGPNMHLETGSTATTSSVTKPKSDVFLRFQTHEPSVNRFAAPARRLTSSHAPPPVQLNRQMSREDLLLAGMVNDDPSPKNVVKPASDKSKTVSAQPQPPVPSSST